MKKISSEKLEKVFVAFMLTVTIIVIIGLVVNEKTKTDFQRFYDARSKITRVWSSELEEVKKVCKNATETAGTNVKNCFIDIYNLDNQLHINYNVLTDKDEYVIYEVVSRMLGQKLAMYLRDGHRSRIVPVYFLEVKIYIDGLERMNTTNVSGDIIYLD